MAWDCDAYYDFLFDRAPHFTDEILKDWFPVDDAWVGHVRTGSWDSFTGTTHVRDRIHVGAPDTSQAWDTFDTQSVDCVQNACSPSALTVAWGSTRTTFDRERKRYETNVLCFDQINTRAKAKDQLSQIVEGIKKLTKTIQSDYMRSRALMNAPTLYLAGSAMNEVTLTPTSFTGAALTMNIGGAVGTLVTSQLTIQYLSRFYEPLQFAGYFKSKYVPAGMFRLLTDPITSQQLTNGNPALTANFRFTDFQRGGELFKYGISAAIGNFGIAWDEFPARFYPTNTNGELRRVWPYSNTAATIGIKPTPSLQYQRAPYQVSWIWHPEAAVRYVPDLTPVHPEMPFMTRDLGGKWNFTGPESDTLVVTDPVTGDTCVIDNKARNQGLWWADFENSWEYQYPEWVRPILHLREPGCVTDQVPCSTAPAYQVQDLSDVNPVCETV